MRGKEKVKRIICGVLASALMTSALFPVFSLEEEYTANQTYTEYLGSVLAVEENAESGISAKRILSATDGKTAYELVATVEPCDNAENTAVVWSMAFRNPASDWASGKEVSDYVTLSYNAESVEGSKIATVSCIQAFGEPIIVTVSLAHAPEIGATCRLDYLRRAADFDLQFGSVQCVWGGYTNFQLDCRSSQSPNGGLPKLTFRSSPYTLDELGESGNQEVTYRLIHMNADLFGNGITGEGATILKTYSAGSINYHLTMGLATSMHTADISLFRNHDVAHKGLFFGYDWMYENMGLRYYSYPVHPSSGAIMFHNYTLAEMKSMPYFSSLMSGSIDFFRLEVTVGGVTKQTTFRMTNYIAG